MTQPLVPDGIYEHYKGHRYRLICIAKLEATLEDAVVYETLYENDLGKHWIRTVADFLAEVEWNGATVPRFRYTGDSMNTDRT